MIAPALMHEPDVLFLDEPSTGLDPAARLFVWDRIRDLRTRGVTVLLTTHDMEEAESLADRVGIMDHGHLLALDTPANLTRSLPGSSTLDVTVSLGGSGREEVVGVLSALDGVERSEALDDREERGPTSRLRLRLYVTGEASQMVAPVAGRLGGIGAAARRCPPRGARASRMSSSHSPGDSSDEHACPARRRRPGITPGGAFLAVLGRDLLRHGPRVPDLPRAGRAAAALPALHLRPGPRRAAPHRPRLRPAPLPGHRRPHRDPHRAAVDGAAARDRLLLHQGDRGPPAGTPPRRLRGDREARLCRDPRPSSPRR